MTITATCPTFCISQHNEARNEELVHLDQDTNVLASNGSTNVTVELMASAPTALIWVGDRSFTPEQAEALVDAVTSRIAMIQAATR